MPFTWFKRSTKPQSAPTRSETPSARPAPPPVEPTPAHTATAVAPSPVEPTPARVVDIPSDKIAQRAYQKWVDRGHSGGSSDQDWRDAEAELRAEYQTTAAEDLPHRSR